MLTPFGREFKTSVALEGPKKVHGAFFGPSKAFQGHPQRAPKGIRGAGTPEIDTVWDYKADGVLFEGALT